MAIHLLLQIAAPAIDFTPSLPLRLVPEISGSVPWGDTSSRAGQAEQDTRGDRSIVSALAARPALNAGEIAAPFDISLPAISRHLAVLEQARLISRVKQGRSVVCRLEPAGMEAAMRRLSETETFWTSRLDALSALLEEKPWPTASSASSKPRR